MDHEITTTKKVIQRVVFDLRDEPVMQDWPGISHRGKPVRLEGMSFIVETINDEEPTVGRLKIGGWLVKKNGTVSDTTRAEEELWGSWWEAGGNFDRFYSREAEKFAHLIEQAREVAKEVLAR